MSIHSIAFSDSAWSWLVGFTRHPDHELRGFAFKTLTRADAGRFGRVLVWYGWSWSPDANLWVNHYGTGALIEATLALPFDQLAPRLAPWRLLEAVRLRGADAAEVRLATAIFGQVLAAEKLDEPDLGSILSIDRTEAQASQFIVSVVPRPTQEEADDPMAALKASMDLDAQIKARRRAAETAVSRITEARKAGASLYITNMDARDFEPVLRHASDLVDNWLEGLNESTADFRRRVHLAEGAFLALCEALLNYDPMRGVQLWRALRAIAETRYIGAAGVEDLVHMVFRVPHSPAVTALREELFKLRNCNTNLALFDIAVAASHNGKTDWLADVIKADRASASVWKRNRSVVLNGFTMNNRLPVAGAWPSGEIKTGHAELDRRSARFRWIEACARHWWRAYVAAHEATQAYAAWVLFLRSADRRAWVWMLEDVQAAKDIGPFFSLKLSHAQLGRSKLKGAMQKRADKLDESFLNRTITDGVGPWAKKLAPLRGEPIPTAGSTSPSSC